MLIDLFSATTKIVTSPILLGFSLVGTTIGVLLGALPGISSTMALAILLPLTFAMSPDTAMVFLMAVFSASVFGGSISAILINIPGTPGAIVTQIDGHPMARQGKAGQAIFYALFASTMGGLFGLLALTFTAPFIASAAMSFRSPEFASAALFGLTMLAYASPGSTFKGVIVGFIGLLCGMVGMDTLTDVPRFEFGSRVLQGGIDMVPLTVGLFGLAELMRSIGERIGPAHVAPSVGRLLPPLATLKSSWSTILRGSFIGSLIGAIPAAGSAIAVAVAYAQEVRFAKTPEQFGKGAPAGIMAPESANNACVGGALIPMMTLGIPGDTMTAVLIGALLLHGMRPGPLLFSENPDFVGIVYASLLVAIIMTVIVGLLAARYVAALLNAPRSILLVGILILCLVGAFAIRGNVEDVYIMIAFGLLGYVMILLNLPVAPLAFGLILGPLIEENVRRSLIVGDGSWTIFVYRPISLCFLLLSAAAILYPIITYYKDRSHKLKKSHDR
jgi:putative tricarboxylic transport membrane protein